MGPPIDTDADGPVNIYRYRFAAECPKNGTLTVYDLTIKTGVTILAEDIIAACGAKGLQEEIANRLSDRFGGEQTLVGTHSGVIVETIR